jgi:hypothetical protein
MSCTIPNPLPTFYLGAGTMLSSITIARSIILYSQAPNTRKALLMLGSILLWLYSVIYTAFYLFPWTKTKAGVVGSVALVLALNYFLIVASCIRYYALLDAKIRKLLQSITNVGMAIIMMYLLAINAAEVMASPSAEVLIFGPWSLLLGIIPVIHIGFGIIGFLQTARLNHDSQSTGYKIISLQTMFTSFVVLLWIVWVIIYLSRTSTGGSNSILLAIAFELENSIHLISKTVKNRLDGISAKSPQGSTIR